MNEEENLTRCLYGEDKFFYHLKTEVEIDRIERFRTCILLRSSKEEWSSSLFSIEQQSKANEADSRRGNKIFQFHHFIFCLDIYFKSIFLHLEESSKTTLVFCFFLSNDFLFFSFVFFMKCIFTY